MCYLLDECELPYHFLIASSMNEVLTLYGLAVVVISSAMYRNVTFIALSFNMVMRRDYVICSRLLLQ